MWIELLPLIIAAFVFIAASAFVVKERWKDLCWLPALIAVIFLLAPDLERQDYIGHETGYLSYFLGEKTPGNGNTLSYPAMQIWWWFWGVLLPEKIKLCTVVGLCWGALGALVFGLWIKVRCGWKWGVIVSIWLVSHPGFLGWSTSPYNVIFPFVFGLIGLFSIEMGGREQKTIWFYLAGSALLWAAAMRLEMLSFFLLGLGWVWAQKIPWKLWLPPFFMSILLLFLSVFPMLYSIPGEGERWLAFQLNWASSVYHAPYDGWLGLLLIGGSYGLVFRKHRRYGLVLLLALLGNHFLMATFDDYGSRHTLFALCAIGWVFVWAAHDEKHWRWVLAAGCLFAHGQGVWELHQHYYASPEQFAQFLKKDPWGPLPSISLQQARAKGCAWIAEAEAVADDRPRSHFNLLNPEEVQKLQKDFGCIDWCYELEDWRWTSLSVRDRAVRIERLHSFQALAVVQHGEYQCVQLRLRERKEWIKTR